MRIASTTVPTSLEQLSMMMFRLRSSCSSSLSVSMPFISGISTSRMMRSGRSPSLTLARTSLPEPTVSTSKPSTSSSVCKYLRMLGSSSTTRIFSFTAIGLSPCIPLLNAVQLSDIRTELSLIHGQKKREPAAVSGFAFDPNFPAMRLHQALGDRQAQTHTRSIAVHADEIFENLLVMFRGDPWAGIGDGHFHAVRTRQTEASAFLGWQSLGDATFPEMRQRPKRDTPPRWRMLQRVVQKIGGGLLHLLIVKAKVWNGRIKGRFQSHAFALESFQPALGEFIEAIAQVVFAQL